jgi:hemerythrin-like domain-containing protein
MLLATYALATLSVEQKQQRGIIARLQQRLRQHAASPRHSEAQLVMAEMEQLSRFAEARHQGKVARCLMPAVRHASADAAPLLADLDQLSAAGVVMLGELRATWQRAVVRDVEQMRLLYRSMELYCQNLLHRLAREEHELLPLAQRVLSSDGWFSIGAGFLSHDAADGKVRTVRKSAPAALNPIRI